MSSSLKLLESLLDPNRYILFLKTIHKLRDKVPEVEDWLAFFNNDVIEFERTFEQIARSLLARKQEVLYPPQVIPIPCYPFTKRPMIQWLELQAREPTDEPVIDIRYYCARLGNLINVAFLTKRFIVIDVDTKNEELRRIADVETRRGLHIIRFLDKYQAVKIKLILRLGDRTYKEEGFKVVLYSGVEKTRPDETPVADIRSGPFFYVMYPVQTRYLVFEQTPQGRKVTVKAYKLISNVAYNAFKSADLEPIRASLNEIEQLIQKVVEIMLPNVKIERIELEPYENVPFQELNLSEGTGVPKRESKYNQNPRSLPGLLTFEQFKAIIERHKEIAPVCLYKCLFESLPRGVKFFHGQFLRAILPYFVKLDEEELKKVIEDWCIRNADKKSDWTRVKYYWLYFTGKLNIDGKVYRVASHLIPNSDSFTTFEQLGYCERCILKSQCLGKNPRERFKLILHHVEQIIIRELGL